MLNFHSLIQRRYIPPCHDVMVTHTHVHAKKEPNGIIAGCHVVQGLLLGETVPGSGREKHPGDCRVDYLSIATNYNAAVVACFQYLKIFQGSPHHLFENFHGSTYRHLEEVHNEEKLSAGMIHYSIVDTPEQSFIGKLHRGRRESCHWTRGKLCGWTRRELCGWTRREYVIEQEGNCMVEPKRK